MPHVYSVPGSLLSVSVGFYLANLIEWRVRQDERLDNVAIIGRGLLLFNNTYIVQFSGIEFLDTQPRDEAARRLHCAIRSRVKHSKFQHAAPQRNLHFTLFRNQDDHKRSRRRELRVPLCNGGLSG